MATGGSSTNNKSDRHCDSGEKSLQPMGKKNTSFSMAMMDRPSRFTDGMVIPQTRYEHSFFVVPGSKVNTQIFVTVVVHCGFFRIRTLSKYFNLF